MKAARELWTLRVLGGVSKIAARYGVTTETLHRAADTYPSLELEVTEGLGLEAPKENEQ